jgi:quinolinate synthase
MDSKFDKLLRLKKERNAVILAHYYQEPEIQDTADFLGDSLALAQAAKKTDADVILFCGVHFMAETAKILNPDKIVLIPDLEAGCSLAESAPPAKFREWVDKHQPATVISYINCTAAVKAMSDIICTSSNADKIVMSVPRDEKVLFAPDKYLGKYVQRITGRDMELWEGTCQVHEIFSEKAIIDLQVEHPDAEVLAHPECPPNVLDYADFIGSTSKIINRASESDKKKFIIATEPGLIHEMEKNMPDKRFIPVPDLEGCACNVCPHMRLNTIDKMVAALENLEPRIELPEDVRRRAMQPLERMLELSK